MSYPLNRMSMIVGGLVVVLIIFGIAFTFTTADQQHRGTPIEAALNGQTAHLSQAAP